MSTRGMAAQTTRLLLYTFPSFAEVKLPTHHSDIPDRRVLFSAMRHTARPRTSRTGMSAKLTPSTEMAPPASSTSRKIAAVSELLPAPCG
jgi:hypothetical protein